MIAIKSFKSTDYPRGSIIRIEINKSTIEIKEQNSSQSLTLKNRKFILTGNPLAEKQIDHYLNELTNEVNAEKIIGWIKSKVNLSVVETF